MNQSCFSLGFALNILSRSSQHFVGIRGIYTCVCLECERSVFPKQGGLVTCPRDLTDSRANCLASLGLLSYSGTAGVTLQLPCMLHTCACFGELQATSHS